MTMTFGNFWAYLEEERSRHVVDSQDRRLLCLANVGGLYAGRPTAAS